MNLIRLAVIATALALLGASTPAHGQAALTHRVKAGDTLQLLAAEYYGDRRHAVFIMVANGMEHPRKLKNGERIQIPFGQEVTVVAGDTWDTLAEKYLGARERGAFLAGFNGADPGGSIAAGTTVGIPLRVTHLAEARVSLSQLAATYLGDNKKAALLKAYNFLDTDELAPGESIVIPIQRVRVRKEKMPAPDEESRGHMEKRRAMMATAREALPDARTAWKSGDYEAIRTELTQIDTDYLDADWAVEIGVLLGAAYIAFDDRDSALATFKKIVERQPNHMLSKVEYSPKICAVWQAAGGQLVEPTR